jgi:hypothetical protein
MSANQVKAHGIFISYRRTDTRADAGRLYDRLANRFSGDHVFMDIDDIQPGQKFLTVLQDTLDICHVLLVLIGPKWLDARDAGGLVRLQDDQDFVRLEVQTALQRGIPVIPILVNRAFMPTREDLPSGIDSLADHQALEISDSRFHDDVNNLIRALERILADGDLPRHHHRFRIAAFGVTALVVALGVFWLASPQWLQPEAVPGHATDNTQQDEAPGRALTLRNESALVSRAEVLGMLAERNFFDASRHPAGTGLGNLYELTSIDGDAVVIDRSTNLMWQQTGSDRQYPFAQAKTEIQSLNKQHFAGQVDWRLPTIEEAMSLLTPTKQVGIHMSPLLSPQAAPILWTADRGGDQAIWVVYAYDGVAGLESDEFNAWARAVRTMR